MSYFLFENLSVEKNIAGSFAVRNSLVTKHTK